MMSDVKFEESDFQKLSASRNDNPYYKFDILETSSSGEISIIQDEREEFSVTPSSLFPAGCPPILPTLEEEVERKFLQSPAHLPIHDFRNTQVVYERDKDLHSLFMIDVDPLTTDVQVRRDLTTGELLDFYESDIIGATGSRPLTSKNSCSLNRAPGPLSEATKGNTTNFPFWPGGMDEEIVEDLMKKINVEDVDFENDLLTCPPGFKHGIKFVEESSNKGVVNVEDLFAVEDDDLWMQEVVEEEVKDEKEVISEIVRSKSLENLVQSTNVFTHTPTSHSLPEQYAVMMEVNKPVSDFREKVPKMAHQYPFELDVFQKQAVICLEEGKNVFVAAHTSAGKTVVAEYAIAMAKHHMTRVIYTSPIKALSNQKYRDFKQTFGDVGLLTGDVQMHPEAFCLIMTTEILRSMLYNGSEVIRDLEWVIFDEVHYINDAERGVVWEEVLIMLPDHCNVILLSATVSNVIEFANWVGRTKKKNIYVVSTLKRPVPLEHYLYTGNSNKTSGEMFLLLDHKRQFHESAHRKAVDAKKERMSKHQKTYGAKHIKSTPASDKGVWLSLIERLRKKDQLPVVAFTFSRKRCDENANTLTSLDLTTSAEKSEIHIFFNKCIQKLRGGDKRLPQVLQMSTLLKRGIAVHHSGILPILKEVIEMLFGRGLVKLLFATETFAMGVNMPARTVVFDSIRKHDGTTMRDLLPGEYIQMAGRAGRRGLDETGTVILLCKGNVPEISDLHAMMLGRPTKLESQFRLTYTMILNLLRVEQVRLEDMMKRSFSEFHQRKNSKAQEERLKELTDKLENMKDVESLVTESGYGSYYQKCEELLEIRKSLIHAALHSNHGLKVMQGGRVIVINTKQHQLSLAITLKTISGKNRVFTVLVLCGEAEQEVMHHLTPQYMLYQTIKRPHLPQQDLIDVTSADICYVSPIKINIKSELILDDQKKRQIPRFKNDPPGQSTMFATQELLRLAEDNPNGLPSMNVVKDFNLNQLDVVEDARRSDFLENEIAAAYSTLDSIRFNEVMTDVESYMNIRTELNHIKYLLSEESLHLLPEYKQRVEVLEQLQYVDEGRAVQLKGRVACEISNNELVLTELVFNNVLTPLEPCEIVALLSCVVFQQKIDMSEVTMPKPLQDGMDEIIAVATSIGEKQLECGLRQPVDDFVNELKFGLTLAVHEWAKGTSFQDITGLTEVQEGIIVRTIQRLNETCRDIRNAARVIGDPTLYQKMEKCSELIKRDIVFAASLYTQ